MEKNVGGIDRVGRIVIGLLAVLAGASAVAGVWEIGVVIGAVALLIGAILLVTGTTQKCPLNEVAGINTDK
jgi:predicted O-methyltransferase YrrM